MLVSNLAGADLALWTARAIKYQVRQESGKWTVYVPAEQCWRSFTEHGWRPDRDWAVGGPLLYQYTIATAKGMNQMCFPGWHAKVGLATAYDSGHGAYFGADPLIAGMRALVDHVYGPNVPDEVAP